MLTLVATRGTLTLASIDGLQVLEGRTSDTTSVTVRGVEDAINRALDGLTFTPERDFSGQASICVDAGHQQRDGDEPSLCLRPLNWTRETTSTQRMAVSIPVRVTPVNDAPTLSRVANRTVTIDSPIEATPFVVEDIDSAGRLTLNATSSNAGLVPSTSIVMIGTGATRMLTVVPRARAIGKTTITITATDGDSSASTQFVLEVTCPVVPAAVSAAPGAAGAVPPPSLPACAPTVTETATRP